MSRLVNLNVGGKKYTTTVQTLRFDPNSMLARMFSDDWRHQSGTAAKEDQNCNNDNEESFIDRDGEHFRYVLNYLRNGVDMVLPVDNANVLNELILEAEFYQLCGFSELLKSKLASTSPSTADRELTKLSKNYSVLFIVAKLPNNLIPDRNSCYYEQTETTVYFDNDSYRQFLDGSDGLFDMIIKELGGRLDAGKCNAEKAVKFNCPVLDVLNFFCGQINEKHSLGSHKIATCKKVDKTTMIWMLEKIKEKNV